ncbi:UNVERIFIED_CONTAM: Retrovirus-related Pol polyprotein from transposon TNT 1-94 [Sesamum latifolium]|uniref:Retrovirus-related Pol polyprotein from transposon TNT 1-94 n=1 Tax=Sesamum latifolium TaxID=2727402 RepID=A0AAW2YBS6_9LAMI
MKMDKTLCNSIEPPWTDLRLTAGSVGHIGWARDHPTGGYVLDKPLPTALPEGSSPEERLTFDKWLEDNRKVRSIILASMTNEILKQYDRLEDVPSIMLCMKEVYAVPNRHIRYAAIKAFFGTKMAEGSSVQSHRVKMVSLVEKLEDLKARLENDTYIDVILQSLPPSYDPFIVNYNMNGLEKSIHELINMLVQYEAMTHKSEPTVLVGRGFDLQGERQGCQTLEEEEGKRVLEEVSATPLQPRKLSKDEMVLRLGDGRPLHGSRGSLSLVFFNLDDEHHLLGTLMNGLYILQQSNLIMTSQHKRKVGDHENAQIWHARLGHISKDRIRRRLDLSTPARGGFSYFITFTDDHSRYGYVYLIRYKSEAFGRFKEYRLEVENQTNRKIKALRSDQGGEYLSGESIDYLKTMEFSLSGLLLECNNSTEWLKGGTEPCWIWFDP